MKAPSQVLQEDERLTRTRNVFIVGAIDDHAANVAIASILFLRHEDERPFTVTLDSPGGVVTSTLAIVDVLRERRASSRTTCVGKAEGVAALILACGALGHRRIARSGTVWIGPVERPEGRVGVEDVLRRMDDVTLDLLVECTGRAREPLREMVAARRRLDAGEAVRYGFADEVF